MPLSYFYVSDFPLKNFCKLAQHAETIRNNVWEQSSDANSLSIRVQNTINHILIFTFLCFLPLYQRQKTCFFFRVRAEKRHCATHWREQRGWDLVIFLFVRSEHAHARFPGLSFRPPGFSHYRGREERRVQGLDYLWPRGRSFFLGWKTTKARLFCLECGLNTNKTLL